MRAKAVVFFHIAPPDIEHGGALFFGADPVLPMVGIRKTTARPPQVGNFQFAQRGYHIISHALSVRNGTAVADVESAVDAPPQVFGKMAINVLVYNRRISTRDCRDQHLALGKKR